MLCPHPGLANNLSRTFARDPVDHDGIFRAGRDAIANLATALPDDFGEVAVKIMLQRLVGAHVSGACAAGIFYSTQLTKARDMTSSAFNDARDEDRDGASGFMSKAQQQREFAAKAGLQAAAALAAAMGAAEAYQAAIGEAWQPYSRDDGRPVTRKAAEAEMAAFDPAE